MEIMESDLIAKISRFSPNFLTVWHVWGLFSKIFFAESKILTSREFFLLGKQLHIFNMSTSSSYTRATLIDDWRDLHALFGAALKRAGVVSLGQLASLSAVSIREKEEKNERKESRRTREGRNAKHTTLVNFNKKNILYGIGYHGD
jgi:hypothetical protein